MSTLNVKNFSVQGIVHSQKANFLLGIYTENEPDKFILKRKSKNKGDKKSSNCDSGTDDTNWRKHMTNNLFNTSLQTSDKV